MYRATLSDKHNTSPLEFFRTDTDLMEYTLTSCVVKKVANQAGECVMILPPGNIAYGMDKLKLLASYIRVYDDDDMFFVGRIISRKVRFDRTIEVTCEGLRGILNDAYKEPSWYIDAGLHSIVGSIISVFNEQADVTLHIGTITIPNETIEYQINGYGSVLERLNDLQDIYGGYLDIVERNNAWYLNWLQDYTTTAEQTIDFGVNLLDLTIEDTAEDICTRLYPFGATYSTIYEYSSDEHQVRLSIHTDDYPYLYIEADQADIDKYGRISHVVIFDDIDDATLLKSEGQKYLNYVLTPKVTINVTAADLSDYGYDIDYFDIGTKVIVNSELHGLNNQEVEVLQVTVNCLNPASNKLVLSSEQKGFMQTGQYQLIKNTKESIAFQNSVKRG